MNNNPGYPKLLIASTQMLDENFEKTVVLLTEHDKKGALGFVVNRKTDFDLGSIIEEDVPSIPRNVPVWYGGPVECESGYILAIDAEDLLQNAEKSRDTYHNLANGITLCTDLNELESLSAVHQKTNTLETQSINPRLRFIIGYAGWGPGQLEQELRESKWVEAAMDKSLLLETPTEDMWDAAFRRIGVPNPAMLATSNCSQNPVTWLN